MFTGVFTAIVTPFINGELDEESLRSLIEFQIAKACSRSQGALFFSQRT
jgi:dihydrodipicolinate synthase/N-acetylneuraminate lyase